MEQPTGVNGTESPTDDRGVPLRNLQAEMSRKMQELDEKLTRNLEAIQQKLEAFQTEPEPAEVPQGLPYDPREELTKISRDPRRYVDDSIKPLQERIDRTEKEKEALRTELVRLRWEQQEKVIAEAEGKKRWDDLPRDFQSSLISILKERNWVDNPSRAWDAYELLKAREAQKVREEPERLERIDLAQSEGSGRVSGKTPVRTLTREQLSVLAADPRNKENMKLLDQVQKGQIKVEGY